MAMNYITTRGVIGEFYKALKVDSGASWVNMVSNYFPSDQLTETYAFLDQVYGLREWVGERMARHLSEHSFTIKNKHYEDTLEVNVSDKRRDKTPQVQTRIAEIVRRANSWWASTLSTLIVNAPSTTCYDGQYFFDTDHSEGDSGTQSNDIQADISAYPVTTPGTTTAPSVAEAQYAIYDGIATILGFKDNTGEPMNEDASKFLVMVPLSLYKTFSQAVYTVGQPAETQTALDSIKQDFEIKVVPNVRLSSWTASFAVFRTDSYLKSFIRQEETGISLKVLAEGSDYEFFNDKHLYGIDTWRNAGYGFWQNSCYVTMV